MSHVTFHMTPVTSPLSYVSLPPHNAALVASGRFGYSQGMQALARCHRTPGHPKKLKKKNEDKHKKSLSYLMCQMSHVPSHQCQQPQAQTAAVAIKVLRGLAPSGAELHNFQCATGHTSWTLQLID